MPSLREKKKNENKKKIVKAAKQLVKAKGDTNFTMKELAAKSEFSTFTIHQYFRTKSSIVFNILMDVLDDITISPMPTDPKPEDVVDHFLNFGDSPVDLYLQNEQFYRAIMAHFMSSNEQSQRLEYQAKARRYWRRAVGDLIAHGLFLPNLIELDIIKAMQISFTGVMEMWVHDEISSEQLRSQIKFVIALNLLACTSDRCKPRLYEVIKASRYW